jgi:hypothetical protein
MREIDYSTVPAAHMISGLQLYVEQGIEPGGFMRALLCNDLRGAVARADAANIARIPHWVVWMENNLPGAAWGSVQNYENWIARGGNGIAA